MSEAQPNPCPFSESYSENPSTPVIELPITTTLSPVAISEEEKKTGLEGSSKGPSGLTLRLLTRPPLPRLRLRMRPTTSTTTTTEVPTTTTPKPSRCDALLRRMRRASRSRGFKPLRKTRMRRSPSRKLSSFSVLRCLAENFDDYAMKRG